MDILGIKTVIHWSWWIFILLLVVPVFLIDPSKVLLSIWASLVLMVIIIGHEFAHALTARYFGYKTKSIILFLLGGMSLIEVKKGLKPKEEFLISLMGPAFNIVFALPFIAIAFAVYPEVINGLWLHCIWVLSLMMGVGNLIPTFPMDGGRMLRAALTLLWSGEEAHIKATRAAHIISGLLALSWFISGIYLNNMFLSLLGLIVLLVAYGENRYVKQSARL